MAKKLLGTSARHAALYLRVSTVDQHCENQEPDLKLWAAAQSLPVRWYRDKFTGKEMARPGFDKLLEDCRVGKVAVVVVWRLHRLGRDARGLLDLADTLEKLGVRLVFVKDSIDLTTLAGRLVYTILAGLAEYEREDLRQRILAGQARAKKEGRSWGGSEKGVCRSKTAEKKAVILTLHREGHSIREIAAQVGLARGTVRSLLRREQKQ